MASDAEINNIFSRGGPSSNMFDSALEDNRSQERPKAHSQVDDSLHQYANNQDVRQSLREATMDGIDAEDQRRVKSMLGVPAKKTLVPHGYKSIGRLIKRGGQAQQLNINIAGHQGILANDLVKEYRGLKPTGYEITLEVDKTKLQTREFIQPNIVNFKGQGGEPPATVKKWADSYADEDADLGQDNPRLQMKQLIARTSLQRNNRYWIMDEVWSSLFKDNRPLSDEAAKVLIDLIKMSGHKVDCEHGKNPLRIETNVADAERLPRPPPRKVIVKKKVPVKVDLGPRPIPLPKPKPLPPPPPEPEKLEPMPVVIQVPIPPPDLDPPEPKPDIEQVIQLQQEILRKLRDKTRKLMYEAEDRIRQRKLQFELEEDDHGPELQQIEVKAPDHENEITLMLQETIAIEEF